MTRALTSLLLLIALAGCVPAFADEAAPVDATATNLYIVSNAEVRKGWRRDQVMEDGTNLVDRSGTIAAKADSAAIETVSNGAAEIAELIGGLREPYGPVCRLCLLEERSPEEAALALGRPVKTIHTQLARGKKLLRQQLERRARDGILSP